MKSKIIKLASLGLVVFFFLPFFAVSCDRQSVPFSGLELTIGKNIMGENIGGNAILIILLLLPLAVLSISFVKNLKKWESIAGGVASVVGLVMLVITRVKVIERAESVYATVNTEIGFYLSVIAHCLILVVAIYDLLLNKNKSTPQILVETKVEGSGEEDSEGEVVSINKSEEAGTGPQSEHNISEQFHKLQAMTSKFIDTSKENLSKSSLLQIGYLVLAGIVFVMLILQIISKQATQQYIRGIILMGISIFLYLKMKYHLSRESALELHRGFEQINKFIVSINIPTRFINLLDKLIYLFIGILLLNIFPYGGDGLGLIINILHPISMYGLFISIVMLLTTTDKIQIAFHGVIGYLGIAIISFLRVGMFTTYKYINFFLGIKILLYWTVAWFLLEYVNQITKNSHKKIEVL